MSHLMPNKKIGNRNGLRLEQDSCWYSRICALGQWKLVKIGTLKRTCVYCDLQAKRDECGYVICTRYS